MYKRGNKLDPAFCSPDDTRDSSYRFARESENRRGTAPDETLSPSIPDGPARSPVYLSACLLPVLRLTPRQFVTPRESLTAILLLLGMSDCPETKERLRKKKMKLKLYLNIVIATKTL